MIVKLILVDFAQKSKTLRISLLFLQPHPTFATHSKKKLVEFHPFDY